MWELNANSQWRAAAKRLRLLVAALGVCVFASTFLPATARAEKFLSAEEAARVSFPQATSMSRKMIAISAEDKKRIEKESGASGAPKEQQVWLAAQGTNAIGCVIIDQVIGKHDRIDYAVAVNTNGAVLQVEILEYREHYGNQVRDPKWRSQFKGKTARSPLALENDVYNITGATLSCRHVTQGVKRVLATYERVVRPRVFGVGD